MVFMILFKTIVCRKSPFDSLNSLENSEQTDVNCLEIPCLLAISDPNYLPSITFTRIYFLGFSKLHPLRMKIIIPTSNFKINPNKQLKITCGKNFFFLFLSYSLIPFLYYFFCSGDWGYMGQKLDDIWRWDAVFVYSHCFKK